MENARIEVEIGAVRFSGQGEQQWLSQQMDKFFKSAEMLTKLAPSVLSTDKDGGDPGTGGDPNTSTGSETLQKFLQSVKVNNQTDRFLATAEWLTKKGSKNLTTNDVTAALRKAQKSRLTNASQCLNSNVSAGRAEKEGSGFYVTDEGRKHLGLQP